MIIISRSQQRALLFLRSLSKPIDAVEAAAHLQVSYPTMNTTLRTLVVAGQVSVIKTKPRLYRAIPDPPPVGINYQNPPIKTFTQSGSDQPIPVLPACISNETIGGPITVVTFCPHCEHWHTHGKAPDEGEMLIRTAPCTLPHWYGSYGLLVEGKLTRRIRDKFRIVRHEKFTYYRTPKAFDQPEAN